MSNLNLFLIALKFQLFSFYIVLPFTTVKDYNLTSDYPSTFMYFYFPNKIETMVKIGTPSQEIPLRIKSLRIPISINSIQMGSYRVVRFNESNSSSYIIVNKDIKYYGENDFVNAIKSKEIMRFNNDNLILENFTFLLGISERLYQRESGVLGLNIANFDWRVNDTGFIKQLKERNIIKNIVYFIRYNKNSNKGDLIIDGLPHEIEPQKYDKNKYEEFYAEVISNSNLGFKAKESYYGDIMVDCEFQIQLAVEDNLIRGCKVFKTILMENFFKDKITRKICDKSIFSNVDDENQEFYYCSKDLNLSEFKNITLSIDNSELKIELDYNDLFLEYENRYYFMMYFPVTAYSYHFKLGKILFKKYILTFNHDNKMIGYYKNFKNEDKEKEKENEEKNEDKTGNKDNNHNESEKNDKKS